MSLRKLTPGELRRHTITWALIVLYLSVFDPVVLPTFVGKAVGTLIIMLLYIIPYYLMSLLVLPKYWQKNMVLLVISMLGIWLGYLLGFRLYLIDFKSLYGIKTEYDLIQRVSYQSTLFLIIVLASFSFFFKKLNLKKLEDQNKREQSLIAKELNFLKNQFNSHITFNFLNFCYSHVHKSSPDAAEAIEMFSDMLRYTLSVKPNEKIALNKEINYISDFIELQKLLSDKVYAEFEVEGKIAGQKILPRILINFVENAFKHGLVNDSEKPVKIKLRLLDNELEFSVKNYISHQKNVMNTGVGQDNIQQVLELYYKDKYTLDIEQTDTFYTCFLTLGI